MQLPAVWITCCTAPNNGSRREAYLPASAIIYRGEQVGLLLYLFFQRIAAKSVGEFDERLELSSDDGLVVRRGRFGIFDHDGRRGRRRWGWGWGWGWCGSRRCWVWVADPSPLFLDICNIFNPGRDSFQSAMDRRRDPLTQER